MSYAPVTIYRAALYLVDQGYTNLGIVGDVNHTYGYHLGKDRVRPGDYSIQTARDKAGLTNAAAALDIGHPDKAKLRSLSNWLVEQCKAKAPGTNDIREVIWSPDGAEVRRWDHVTRKVTMQGDATHRWHTHISYYRDSQARAKVDVFEPYFTEPPDTGTGEDVPYEFKVERWALDGGPAKVTTLGAPKRADGTVDYTRRLALLSGAGGADPRLDELPRARLSAPDASLTEEFYADLASYSRPTDVKHKVTVQVDGTTAAEVTV